MCDGLENKDWGKMLTEIFDRKAKEKIGRSCPKCSTDMEVDETNLLLTNPPRAKATCPKCGHVGSVAV